MRIIYVLVALALSALAAPPAKIVLVAGKPSHPPREHEYTAGCKMLAKFLEQNKVETVVVTGGWPADESVFDGAREVVLSMDGGTKHVLTDPQKLAVIDKLAAKGVGIAMLHYAVEIPKDNGGPQFIRWIGGFYDRPYSKNPVIEMDLVQASPKHPISRGWKGFHMKDEWYHHIRFEEGDKRVTPILTATVPGSPDSQILAWATQRADGGRGFGFTGLHFHDNLGVPDYRRLLVNALLWTAKVDVPRNGAKCDLAPGDLDQNLDVKPDPRQNRKKAK